MEASLFLQTICDQLTPNIVEVVQSWLAFTRLHFQEDATGADLCMAKIRERTRIWADDKLREELEILLGACPNLERYLESDVRVQLSFYESHGVPRADLDRLASTSIDSIKFTRRVYINLANRLDMYPHVAEIKGDTVRKCVSAAIKEAVTAMTPVEKLTDLLAQKPSASPGARSRIGSFGAGSVCSAVLEELSDAGYCAVPSPATKGINAGAQYSQTTPLQSRGGFQSPPPAAVRNWRPASPGTLKSPSTPRTPTPSESGTVQGEEDQQEEEKKAQAASVTEEEVKAQTMPPIPSEKIEQAKKLYNMLQEYNEQVGQDVESPTTLEKKQEQQNGINDTTPTMPETESTAEADVVPVLPEGENAEDNEEVISEKVMSPVTMARRESICIASRPADLDEGSVTPTPANAAVDDDVVSVQNSIFSVAPSTSSHASVREPMSGDDLKAIAYAQSLPDLSRVASSLCSTASSRSRMKKTIRQTNASEVLAKRLDTPKPITASAVDQKKKAPTPVPIKAE